MEEGVAYLKQLYLGPHDYHRIAERRAYDFPFAIGVVNIARLVGAEVLLPMALFDCCQLGEEILDGFLKEDGTREHLSLDDQKRCLKASYDLRCARICQAIFIFERFVPPDDCEDSETDAMMVKDHFDEMFCSMQFHTVAYFDAWTLPKHICQSCNDALDDRLYKQSQKVYNLLPICVGVTVAEGWPEAED